MNETTKQTPQTKTALIAGGCFWCVEADLEKLNGVISAVSGYAGGSTANPTYENYASQGHREVVEVTYDPQQLAFANLIVYALKHMDPTDSEGSFYDRGESYSPALYYDNAEEKQIIENIIAEINEHGPYEKPLAVAVLPRPAFYPAEDYHQDYYKGTLSSLKYQYYRQGSGRDAFIKKHWGDKTDGYLPWTPSADPAIPQYPWQLYQKPPKEELRQQLSALAYEVTQEDGTERAGSSPLDKEYGRGIYVDILSGEPLFSSRDKFDSGTGWPSFTQPIQPGAVTTREDRRLFSVRTEIRSAIADNHLGHVFPDAPKELGGLRYCMNGVALRFVPEDKMVEEGYADWLSSL